jgi:ABC-type multidrug transport system fused ATPase/permease subunit
MALARWTVTAGRPDAAARPRRRTLGERLRRDAREVAALLRDVHWFTREFDRQAIGIMLVGLAIVAWEILVPLVGARVVDATAAKRPFSEVALLIIGLAALMWVPHGNLLPYVLELLNIRRYSVKLQGYIAVLSLRAALLNRENLGRVAAGEIARGDAQPVLVEARENIHRLALRIVKEIPVAVRGVCVLVLLVYMVPLFVPFLLLGAAADLAITYRMGARLEPHFQARQDAENAQRRLENELLAAHFGRDLSEAEADRIIAPYEAAVRDRVGKEIAAEGPALRYKLQRDLVFNGVNVTAWLVGAWYVTVGENPIGSFLFFVAGRAGRTSSSARSWACSRS